MQVYHPHKHHRLIPIMCLAFGIPVAAVTLFLLVGNLLYHDEAAPNDSALLLKKVTIAEAQNAYPALMKMSSDYAAAATPAVDYQPQGDIKITDMLAGKTVDEAYAATAIKQYALAMADLQAAMELPFYQDKIGADPTHFDYTKLPSLTGVQAVARLVALEGLLAAQHGNIQVGINEEQRIIRFGHEMEMGQGTLIEYLVGSSVKQIGLQALRQIALQTALTATQAKITAEIIESSRDSRDGLATAMKLEYSGVKQSLAHIDGLGTMLDEYSSTTIDGVTQRSSSGRFLTLLDNIGVTKYYYFPNQTLRFAADNAKQRVALAMASCTTSYDEHIPTYSHLHGLAKIFEPNAVGKYLSDIGVVALTGANIKQCDEGVSVSATQAVLAISAYQKDRGTIPPTLDTLVPTYLDIVPTDPFSGQAMRYSVEKKIVYSVGANHQDIGGTIDTSTSPSNMSNDDNPSFAVRP